MYTSCKRTSPSSIALNSGAGTPELRALSTAARPRVTALQSRATWLPYSGTGSLFFSTSAACSSARASAHSLEHSMRPSHERSGLLNNPASPATASSICLFASNRLSTSAKSEAVPALSWLLIVGLLPSEQAVGTRAAVDRGRKRRVRRRERGKRERWTGRKRGTGRIEKPGQCRVERMAHLFRKRPAAPGPA